MTRSAVSWRTAIVAAILVSFVLRAHQLDGMSLWSDEDITADRAAMTAGEMMADLPAEHTPIYFLSMIPWTRAAGGSDFALRYPSLLAGVLAVAAAAAVGAVLVGRKAAIVLAIVMAVNPFMVWYGQEARMYALLSALGLLALGAVLVARRTGRRRWWVASGLLAATTVLVHYYGALTVAVLGAWAILDWRHTQRSGWLTAGAIAILALAPWLPRARGLLDYPGWRDPVPLADVPLINLVAWTAGETHAPAWTPAALAVYLVLAAAGGLTLVARSRAGARGRELSAERAGLAPVPDRGHALDHGHMATYNGRAMARFALAFVLAPLAVAAIAVVRQPDFHPRYFTAVVPALYLWAATGAVRWRLPALRAASVAALLLAAAPPLARLYGDPVVQKQDYKTWVALVEAAAGHEDTVLFIDGPSYGLARRYEMDDSPVKIVNLRSSGNLEQTPAERTAEIAELASDYPHLWLATTPEALGEAEAWLMANAYVADEPTSFQAITLERFLGPAADEARSIPMVLTALPADATLWANMAQPSRAAAGSVLPMHIWVHAPNSAAAGDPTGVGAPPGTRASIRLVDEAGAIVATADRPLPASHIGHSPSNAPLRFGLTIPPDAAGRLTPEVHLYTSDAGELGRFTGSDVLVTAPETVGD